MNWAQVIWRQVTLWLRANGRCVFCAPGLGQRIVTPVANAFADSIPLLVITGQVDRRYMNRNILQYADIIALFNQFCKSRCRLSPLVKYPI